MIALAAVIFCLTLLAFASGFMVGRTALVYRRRWKESLALIERLSADDDERKRQWETERRNRALYPPFLKPALSPNQQLTLDRIRKLKEKSA